MTKIVFEKRWNFGVFQVYNDTPPFEVINVNQVHGSKIVEVGKGDSSDADGIIALKKSIPLAIRTADCLPVAVFGKKGNSMIHAGWRGVSEKILTNPALDKIKPHLFFIGPCIGACCYEVQGDFKNNFKNSRNFINSDRIFFDLEQEAVDQIKSVFPEASVIKSNMCTCCNEEFNSYRRNKTSVRNWNVLIMS